MSIRPYIKDGKKFYEVHVKIRDKGGKQINKKRRGFTNFNKAKACEYELKQRLDTNSEKSVWTWREWHNECIKRMRLTLKESTILGYDGEFRKWLDPEWKDKKLHAFSKNDIYDLIYEYLPTLEASAYVQHNILKKIKRIFEMAVEEEIISRNPALGLRVKLLKPKQLVLTSKEADLLLEKAKDTDHRFYLIWAFALFTGMRSGEMYALRWCDIDLDAGNISINKQYTSKDGVGAPKNRENRIVPISSDLKELLTELKLKGGFKEILWHWEDRRLKKKRKLVLSDLVLPRLLEWKNGEQAQVLKEFCRAIQVTEVKFHDLRATFITNLLAQGVPLVTVMAIVGHRKMSTTDEYLRLAGVSVKGATNKLGYNVPKKQAANVFNLFEKRG